jgi:6-phospho-beta-glucosidase
MGVKVAVIGGGSTYTPELIDGFVARRDRLPVDELVLQDVDPDRLSVVGSLAGRILTRQGWSGRLVVTSDQAAALDGADFVLIQLRVGGQAARHVDETLPVRFGCVGQETTGPGGFAKALRTVPVVTEIAGEVGRRSARGAWIVDFTNPVGIVTQALLDAGHRAIGLCNVAITLQRRIARLLAVEPDRVQLEHVGLNHLSWERAVLVDGIDRLGELLEEHGTELAAEIDLPPDLLRILGVVPSYYLRYYYCEEQVVAEERRQASRAEEVMEIERELLALYADPSLDYKPELLERRGGAFYSEAAAQLIASLHAGTGDVQVVDVRNGGALPGIAADAVVEVPARIDRDGAHPVALAPLAPELAGLVAHAKAYERLAVEAALTGDRDVALRALLANPLVGQFRLAAELLDALLEANAAYLPRFAGRPG